MENEKFCRIRDLIVGAEREHSGIGTLSEKSLHAVLKEYYLPENGFTEVKLGRYVADIAYDGGVIEIQTRAFNRLRDKLTCFLQTGEVTVVYPIPAVKFLCWINSSGEITKKRKSPRAGTVYDAFIELYKIRSFLSDPHLHLKLVLLRVTEYRFLDGWSDDGKRGSTRCERFPDELLSEVNILSTADYRIFLPDGLPDEFTSADYAVAAKIRPVLARTALNVLKSLGIVRQTGKRGRLQLYSHL